MILVLALTSALVTLTVGYPHGAPLSACSSMIPVGHNTTAQSDKAPFTIEVSNTCYNSGHKLEVTVSRSSAKWGTKEMFFEGLFVQARPATSANTYETTSMGTFSSTDPDLKTLKCFNTDNSALTHKQKAHYNDKTFLWTAPASASKNFAFQFTMVRETDEFWLEVRSAQVKFDSACVEKPISACSISSASLALLSLATLASLVTKA